MRNVSPVALGLVGLIAVGGHLGGSQPAEAAPGPCVSIPLIDSRCESWVATYDHPDGYSEFGWDGVRAMVAAPTGDRVFVTGFSHDDAAGDWDIATVAFDAASGQRLWIARYGSGRGYDDPADVAVSPDGARVFVAGLAGSEFDHNDGDAVILAYDAATGAALWTRVLDESGGLDLVGSLAVSPNGTTLYSTGSSRSAADGAHTDARTYAFDVATGTTRWSAAFNGSAGHDDQGVDLLPTPEAVYVAVTSVSQNTFGDYDSDIVVVAYENSDPEQLGEELWNSRHSGGAKSGDGAVAISRSPDASRLYVAGVMQGSGSSASGYNNYDYATIALNPATGSRLWKKLFQGPSRGISSPTGMVVTPSDVVLVTGRVSGQTLDTDSDFGTVAYRGSTGEQIWARSYGFPRGDFESAEGIAVSPDGARAYVTGFSRVDQRQDIVTIAYEVDDGTEAWVARYNNHLTTATNFDLGEAIAATGSGDVLVAASITDNLAFNTNPGTTNFNYGDFGLLSYQA
jgi:DNA-binding beta-propeller fold protein YncE